MWKARPAVSHIVLFVFIEAFSPGLTIIVHIPAKPKLQMQLRSTRYHETAALPKCSKWKISSGEICDLKWIMTAMHENLYIPDFNAVDGFLHEAW